MEGQLLALEMPSGRRLWTAPLEAPSEGGGGFLGCTPAASAVAIYGSPAVAGDLVYVGGYNGKIYAFAKDETISEPMWVYPPQDDIGSIVGGLIVDQGMVYFGAADGKVYALDATRPVRRWEFPTEGKIWSTPAIDGDTLFIGSFDNKLYALDAADGSKKWEFETEGAIVATPLVYNNTVYIGSFDRYLYAIDATDGSLKWKFMAENWFWAKPLIYNNTIYAANLDGKVYALNAASGIPVEENPFFDLLGDPISSSPALSGNFIIVATEKGVVYALDTEFYQQRQLVDLEEKVYAPLIVSDGIVYVHTEQDALYAVNVQSGAKQELNIKTE
jgi:outer membrane protein assembly factor BamB